MQEPKWPLQFVLTGSKIDACALIGLLGPERKTLLVTNDELRQVKQRLPACAVPPLLVIVYSCDV